MAWSLAGVTIHGYDDSGSLESLYSRQNVLDATADTAAFYGAKSVVRGVGFTLIEDTSGSAALTTLKTALRTDANVTLISDRGNEGSFRILKLSYKRVQALNYTLPVWDCSVELLEV